MQGDTSAPSNLDASREELFSRKYNVEQRIKWKIEIKSIKSMKALDYINSLPLEESFRHLLQKKKSIVEQEIYFFEIDITDAKAHKSTVKWNLRKRYVDFVHLAKDIEEEIHKGKKMKRKIIPPLPKLENARNLKEVLLFQDTLGSLTHYLQNLVDDTCFRENSQALYEFLEISLLPLPDGPKKYKEGYMKKRTGGRYKENICQVYCGLFCRRWVRRWFIVNNEGILYTIDSNSTRIREMLLFDRSFRIEYGRKATGTKKGISLITPNRKLNLRAENLFEAVDWIVAISEAVRECPYIAMNRYSSFAPVRPPTALCKWYVDGEHYFEDIYNSLLHARKEVFIADWWLSPELHLKRPVVDETNTYRLDTILSQIANRGVVVYIIVYREVKIALNNDSEYTKKALEALSPNIKVLRHPKEFLCLWSHHEKMVVIDQTIGYIGGLDLCYGRMDLNSHPLHDPALEQGIGETFPGIDFVNLRTSDFRNVRDFNKCTIDKMAQPRMPWHDIAMRVVGEPTRDLSRHFIQYWNFATIDLQPGKDEYFLTPLENKPARKNTIYRKNSQDLSSPSKKPGLGAKISQILKKSFAHFETSPTNNPDPLANENDKSYFEQYMETQINQPNILSEQDNWDNASVKRKATMANKEYTIIHETSLEEREEESVSAGKQSNEYYEEEEEKYSIMNSPPQRNFDFKFSLGSEDIQSQQNIPSGTQSMRPSIKRKLTLKEKSTTFHEGYDMPQSLVLSKTHSEDPMGQSARIGAEEKKYNKQFLDILKKARDKEKAFRTQINEMPPARSTSKKKMFESKPSKNNPRNNAFERVEKRRDSKKLDDRFFEKNMLKLSVIQDQKVPDGKCCCQVVRSASNWSMGLQANKEYLENSIQVAYVELIKNARHFIYIENQFFISSTAGEPVTNEIVHALAFRIEKAHLMGQDFKVIVFLPLLPGFEGEVEDPQSTVLRIQLHWEYFTICRGGKSLLEELERREIDPKKYITFYSLRQHGKMNGVPVTEIIYIHSKLMIIDDDKVIMGSANINDRSMQGSRDSEIAMVVEDQDKIPMKMNGKEILVGGFAHTLRVALYKEHLNFYDDEVEDPLDPQLIERMDAIAKINTKVFREVFACYPDDGITKLQDIKEFKQLKNLDRYDELVGQIQGNLVEFPLNFLVDDDLTFAMTNKEYFVPDINFT